MTKMVTGRFFVTCIWKLSGTQVDCFAVLICSLRCCPLRRIPANMDPAMLCHTLKMAPGSVASGLEAKLAVASDTASPLFCMPTSMAMAVAFGYSIFRILAYWFCIAAVI